MHNSTILLTKRIRHVFPYAFFYGMNVECRNSELPDTNTLCAKYDDLYMVIRVRSFLVNFESTIRNEMEEVIDEIYFPVGSLNGVPYRGKEVIRKEVRFPNLSNLGVGEVVRMQFRNADSLVEYSDQ